MEVSSMEQLTEAQHRIAELEAELAVKQHQLAAQERINQLAATLAAREQHHPPPNGRTVTRDFLGMALKDAVSGLNNGNGDQVQSSNGAWPDTRGQPPPLSRFYHQVPGGPMAFFPALWQPPLLDQAGPGSDVLEGSGSASAQGWRRSPEAAERDVLREAAAEQANAVQDDTANSAPQGGNGPGPLNEAPSTGNEAPESQRMDQDIGGGTGVTPGSALAGAWQALLASPGLSSGAAPESSGGLPSPPVFWDASPGAHTSGSPPVPNPVVDAPLQNVPAASSALPKESNSKGSARRKLKRCLADNCSKGAAPPTPYCIRHGGGIRCQVDGCDSARRAPSNFCRKHGGGRRCQHEGCTKAAYSGYQHCAKHGGGKRCTAEGCGNFAEPPTHRCKRHGGGLRCQAEGCRKSARRPTAFCSSHGGGRRCQAAGCQKPAVGKTFCRLHGTRGGSTSRMVADVH